MLICRGAEDHIGSQDQPRGSGQRRHTASLQVSSALLIGALVRIAVRVNTAINLVQVGDARAGLSLLKQRRVGRVRLIGSSGRLELPRSCFELHAPVLVLCRAQSTLGGLHTRDEGWQDDSKRRDPSLPSSSRLFPPNN